MEKYEHSLISLSVTLTLNDAPLNFFFIFLFTTVLTLWHSKYAYATTIYTQIHRANVEERRKTLLRL